MNDADFVDVIHTSEDFGLYENSGHMDFFTNTDKSKEDTCKDIRIRDKDTDGKIILYEDENKDPSNTTYEEVYLEASENITKRGIGSFFLNVLTDIKKLPKRVFIKTHQFFGCSHLMVI
jgi:hypothetical protein